MEGSEDEEEAGIEVFGALRLQLAPGTRSRYIGVRPNKLGQTRLSELLVRN